MRQRHGRQSHVVMRGAGGRPYLPKYLVEQTFDQVYGLGASRHPKTAGEKEEETIKGDIDDIFPTEDRTFIDAVKTRDRSKIKCILANGVRYSFRVCALITTSLRTSGFPLTYQIAPVIEALTSHCFQRVPAIQVRRERRLPIPVSSFITFPSLSFLPGAFQLTAHEKSCPEV